MVRKLTKFEFFKDTPLNDFQNTIHFISNSERDDYFGSNFSSLKTEKEFNFIRDRLTIRVPFSFATISSGYNYARFMSDFEPNEWYYCFLGDIKYHNDQTTEINLIVDVIMTFTQGAKLEQLTNNVTVVRQHLSNKDYRKYLPILRTNDDILKTFTKQYTIQYNHNFNGYYVILTSSADLTKNFGSVDKPKLVTSKGQVYDKLTSPQNLYVVHQQYYSELMEILADYPWIAQNISSNALIPVEFFDDNDLETVKMNDKYNFSNLLGFKKGAQSKNYNIKLSIDPAILLPKLGLDVEQDLHLFRNEYNTCEIYSIDGQSVILDTGFISLEGALEFRCQTSLGYHNQAIIYPIGYKSDDHENTIDGTGWGRGTYANNALIFNNFNKIPTLIDNYKLGMAQNANQRQLAEDKLITNRVQNVMNPKANLKDRFFNAVNILSNINPTNLMGKFTDEYEFYRTQKAEFADLKLTSPTITSQDNSNSFQIANDVYGFVVKFTKPDNAELKKVRDYYKQFGYQLDIINAPISSLMSMSIMNYLEIKGNYRLIGMPTVFNEQLHSLLENGIKFWHPNNKSNPMDQNISENKRVL